MTICMVDGVFKITTAKSTGAQRLPPFAEIRWNEEAHRWLGDIHDYIAADNPGEAQKVVSGIYEKAKLTQDSNSYESKTNRR